MKSHTEYLTFNIPARMGFLNIPPTVEDNADAPLKRQVMGREVVA